MKRKEKVFEIIFLLVACISIVAVAMICIFLFANGIPAMGKIGLGKFLGGQVWKPGNDKYGIFPMIIGSLYTSPEYHKAIQTCAALMEQLSQRLSKEDYALVEELRAQNAIAQCEESESHFKYGFSAGLIVHQEAYEQLQNKK